MSSSVKLIADQLDVKLRFNKLGNELSFVIDIHFDGKKSLKSLAFSLKLVTSLLPILSGGIRGIFLPFTKVFKIDQNVLTKRVCSWINKLLMS